MGARRAKKSETNGWAIAGGVVVAAAGALTLAYLMTGRREQDSPVIPNAIEDQIDQFVAWLDETFGEAWVSEGMDRLQQAVSRQMPMSSSLLRAVVAAEQSGLRGPAKRDYAVQRLRPVN